jgi:mRNA interferase RelE/StbE
MKVRYRPAALADLKRLDPPVARRILLMIDRYAVTRIGDVKRLQGATSEFRLRVGDWRVRFTVEEPDAMRILRVLHRSEAYRSN